MGSASILVTVINKEVVEIETNFLTLFNTRLNNSPFYHSYKCDFIYILVKTLSSFLFFARFSKFKRVDLSSYSEALLRPLVLDVISAIIMILFHLLFWALSKTSSDC